MGFTNTERFYIRESNGGRYCILNAANNLIVVQDISEADTFTAEEVNHHISGKKRHFYEAVPVQADAPVIEADAADEANTQDTESASVKAANEASLLKNSWNGIVAQLSYLTHHAGDYETELQEQLKSVQEEICDIQHYLELRAETPEDAQSAAMMLQGSLQRRREIKDAMLVLDVLRNGLLTQDLDNKITSCRAQIEAMDYRHYRPRQLPELFADRSLAS